MELKDVVAGSSGADVNRSNRTFMELKVLITDSNRVSAYGFNRTFMVQNSEHDHPDAGKEGQKLAAGDTLCYVDMETGDLVKVQTFISTMACTDYTFALCVPSQKTEDFLYALGKALEFYDGMMSWNRTVLMLTGLWLILCPTAICARS